MERARGSLSRSTLLLRESILEADGEGSRRREGGERGEGRLKERRRRGVGERTVGRRVAAGES